MRAPGGSPGGPRQSCRWRSRRRRYSSIGSSPARLGGHAQHAALRVGLDVEQRDIACRRALERVDELRPGQRELAHRGLRALHLGVEARRAGSRAPAAAPLSSAAAASSSCSRCWTFRGTSSTRPAASASARGQHAQPPGASRGGAAPRSRAASAAAHHCSSARAPAARSPLARLRSRSSSSLDVGLPAVVHRGPALRRDAREAGALALGKQQPRAFARNAAARGGCMPSSGRAAPKPAALSGSWKSTALMPSSSAVSIAQASRLARRALPSPSRARRGSCVNWKRASASSSSAVARAVLLRQHRVAHEMVRQHDA